MAYVIDTVKTVAGEWIVDGTKLNYCRMTKTPGRLNARSLYGYADALGGCGGIYVTSSILKVFRAAPDWAEILPMIISEVVDSPMTIIRCEPDWYKDPRYEHILKTGAIIGPVTPDDPCKDVSCPDMCVGVDKYDQVCQDGVCIQGALIEYNSEHCGYTPEPDPDPTPTPSSDTYIIVALMLAGTYMILRR